MEMSAYYFKPDNGVFYHIPYKSLLINHNCIRYYTIVK
jgi:hypothetical protein